ncbi:hypothetical protein [Oceanicella sp. SM1341]|uniref:hypothetical protein n=1 Tax=Oceanicella sp. SM1341 TaxID=1548889 RepID=UPI0018E4FC0D|nr:hypothetical protein [Oceanicella sp. SM1341]
MLHVLGLLAPALMPSWRFFREVAPSPRIEYALVSGPAEMPARWTEARPRPARLRPLAMLGRLFWNPGWNETLFLVSCAERMAERPTAHSTEEIRKRLARGLAEGEGVTEGLLRFRLVFVEHRGGRLRRHVIHVSGPLPLEPRPLDPRPFAPRPRR